MKVALLPKETRGNRVNATLVFRYGSENELNGKTDAASMIGPMLMRGTKQLTQRQIQDRLAELKSQVRIGAGGGMGAGRFARVGGAPGALDVSIETTRENLLAVLDLVGEILREPAFPADEFDKLQREALAGLEQQISEPMMLAMNEIQRRLNPYAKDNIRYVPTPSEQIERTRALQLEDVKAVYAQYLGSGAAQAAFIGDFDPQQVRASLEKLFGDWKSARPYERIVGKYQAIKPDFVAIHTPDKANAMFTIGLPIEMRDDDPDYPALFLANFMLGGNANSRFLNRIRQKEGLSYGCGASIGISPQDKSGTFMGFGICAPQNAQRAIDCAREEMQRFIKEGVTQQELDDARQGYRQQISVQLANDSLLAMLMTSNLYLGRTFQFNVDLLKRIEALTPKDVQAALAKYVQPDKLVVIRAGDFKDEATDGKSPATEKKPAKSEG
jgi:zinc protease